MARAIGHGDAVGGVEEIVDLVDAIEGVPAFGWIFGSARDEERARGHKNLDFVEVASGFEEAFVGAGARI